ncbi:hypothetical protein SXHG_00010 [Synechococcus phage MRHenn-2013a]|nr:hypothetical protein SXHG_00010 [Synechococcus phage MRHenn-2013a]
MDNKHMTGVKSELRAAIWFSERGYSVFFPLLTQSRVDFVVIKGPECIRVQVKTATWSISGKYKYLQVRLKSRDRQPKQLYSKEEVDVIFVIKDDNYWMIPIGDVEGLTSLCLESTNPKPKYHNKQYNPESYRVEPGDK